MGQFLQDGNVDFFVTFFKSRLFIIQVGFIGSNCHDFLRVWHLDILGWTSKKTTLYVVPANIVLVGTMGPF